MKLLVDGDVIAYRAGFATDKTKYLVTREARAANDVPQLNNFDDAKAAKEHAFSNDGVVWSRKETEPEDKAIMLLDIMLGEIYARFADQNPSLVVLLSGVGNYRHGIATRANYKGNRAGSIPPTHLKAIRTHLQLKHGAVVSHGEEADDVMAREFVAHPGSILVSQDKDFLQLAGRHYNFVTKEEQTVSPKDAVLNLYSQIISGDTADNILGATGYGPVKSKKALEACKNSWECWQVALGIYIKEFGTISGPLFALEAARLIKLNQKDKLWEPPTEPSKSASGATSGKRQVVGSGQRAVSDTADTGV